MLDLADLVARSLLDNMKPGFTAQQLEAAWATARLDPQTRAEALEWLVKLEESSPGAAKLLREGWYSPFT